MIEGPRAARADELPAVIGLANTVFGAGRPHDMGKWFPTLFHPDNCRRLRVCVDSGRPVSLVGLMVNAVHAGELSFKVGCIGSVCTLEEYRGRQLASGLMDDALRVCREEGVAVLMISGARGLYRRMGAIPAGGHCTASISRATRLPRLECELREWLEKDVPALAKLYGREPVRFERRPEEFLAFLRAGVIEAFPGRTWVVGAPLSAWLCAQDPREDGDGRIVSIREFGGSRLAMLAALPRLFDGYSADRIDLDFQASDVELGSLLAAGGIQPVPRSFHHHTVRVLDGASAARLASDRARAVLPDPRRSSLRVAGDASSLRLEMGAEALQVESLAEATALLFGSPELQPTMPAAGPLRSAMEALFPIPLVDYGLNYI